MMLTILSIAIGLILVLLLMSILSSTVHDIIVLFLSLRGKHLQTTLRGMLGGMSTTFDEHPFFQQLRSAESKKNWLTGTSLPTWIQKETFSAILHDELQKLEGGNLAEKIDNIQDPNLKELMGFLVRESNGTVGGFKTQLENWFDQVMERASDYFKQGTKWRLFFIGLALSALLNADTINIYKSLSTNPELREKLVKAAEQIAAADTLPVIARDSSLKNYIGNAKGFLSTQLGDMQSPLGLGWNEPSQTKSIPDWLVKMLGFILTGIAVTFGASFWFDLLKKLLSLRSSIGGGSSDTDSNFAGRRSFNMPEGIDGESIGELSDEHKAKKATAPPPSKE